MFDNVVVIHLGTNGPFEKDTLDAFLEPLSQVPNVIMLNVHANRSWTASNNQLLADRDKPGDNIIVIDWNTLATQCPGDVLRRRRHPPERRSARSTTPTSSATSRTSDAARTVAGLGRPRGAGIRSAAMTTPVRVAVTGAAGQIGYSLLFRIASGSMLGPDTPVALQLLEITPALGALNGVKMELDDCAFPLLTEVVCTDDADVAFGDADVALLVGAMPRKDGMDRADLLSANGGIFKPQGEALSRSAKRDVKVLVVGNPANTNALIAMSNAADLDPGRFTAMTRLDHNRAITQLAAKLGVAGHRRQEDDDLGQPLEHAVPRPVPRRGRTARTRTRPIGDHEWVDQTYIPTVATRGGAIIKARGASSAASAANAAVDHIRSWSLGTPEGDWVSMGIPSDGSYGVPEGIISSFPCTCTDGEYSIVQGLDIDDYSRAKIDASAAELVSERDAVEGPRPDLTHSASDTIVGERHAPRGGSDQNPDL